MKKYRKKNGKMKKAQLAALCCSGLLVLGLAGCAGNAGGKETEMTKAVETTVQTTMETTAETESAAEAETVPAAGTEPEKMPAEDFSEVHEMEKIWGPILRVEKELIAIDNQAQAAGSGEVLVLFDPENPNVLDADGLPVQPEDLREGDMIYAYIGPAMTLSLPPQVNSELIILQTAEETAVPDYVHVKTIELQETGGYLLTSNAGGEYQIPEDCEIIPFLTRNRVMLTDIQSGSRCLLWLDEQKAVKKIVLFAE